MKKSINPIEIVYCSEVIDNWGRTESSFKPKKILETLTNIEEWTDDQTFSDKSENVYSIEDLFDKPIKVGDVVLTICSDEEIKYHTKETEVKEVKVKLPKKLKEKLVEYVKSHVINHIQNEYVNNSDGARQIINEISEGTDMFDKSEEAILYKCDFDIEIRDIVANLFKH